MTSSPPARLKILIVGAGIAGLSAAIACRRAGHTVHVYERSALNNEVGAAIHMPPNATRGLLAWGLDPVRGRFVMVRRSYRAHAKTMVKFHDADETYVEEKYGAPWFLAHRVDLHGELKRIAMDAEGEGEPAVVHLKKGVVKYDVDNAVIHFADGGSEAGDLVVAADGVHSGAVEAILGAPNPALPTANYNFAYRFLIPANEIAGDPEIAHFLDGDDGRMKFIVGEGCRLIWYPCRNNEVHNLATIFHSNESVDHEDWHTPVDQSRLLEQCKDFHPSVLAVLRKAKDIKQWPLLFRAPIPTWHRGKLLLIGDASHPMLPHQGQGGAQAIEDAVALGIALADYKPGTLNDRILKFDKIRRNRASVMTVFSNAGQDEPEKIRQEAARFMPANDVPKTPEEFCEYNFGYDVIKDSKQMMQESFGDWKLPSEFFKNQPREVPSAHI